MNILKLIMTLSLLFSLSAPLWANEVQIPAIPKSSEEFTQYRNSVATTPEGGAAATVAALLAFSENEKVGMQCLTLILDRRNVGRGDVIKGYAPSSAIMYHVNRISGYKMWPYLGYAYLKGAKASQNYTVSAPYSIVTKRQRNSGTNASGKVKIFVHVDGFRPRPITLRRNDKGLWKAMEMSSLFLNVQGPARLTPKDDL